jgi:hypothetical protein
MFEFDADGRIWVVEMRGWMLDLQGTGEADPIGQVVVLEDTDGDTFMDKSTVFLDKLVMPRTVSFVQGGVLVAEPPNLWYCQDKDGDLQCDTKELVGQYGRPGNPEHTNNSLFHSIDNWMYSAKTATRHRFRDGQLIEDANFFRGQWGMTQDDYGRLFYNYENSSLHCDLIPATYMLRNQHLRSSHGLNVNIATEAHEVFPIRVTPGITLGATELRDDGTQSYEAALGNAVTRRGFLGTAATALAASSMVDPGEASATDPPKPYLLGYPDRASYQPGDTLALHISTNAETYDLAIARCGLKRQVVWSRKRMKGREHPIPKDASANDCRRPGVLQGVFRGRTRFIAERGQTRI